AGGGRPGAGTPRPAAAREPRWQRAAGYANQAVLPFYLLHEPVIVAFAWIIVRWHVPIGVKYPALVAVSFAATLAIYELAVRRYRPTRFLFRMKTRYLAVRDRHPSGTRAGAPTPRMCSGQRRGRHFLSAAHKAGIRAIDSEHR